MLYFEKLNADNMRADGSRPNEGRPRAFKSPEDLWDAFCKYENWVESNPILVHDFVGKDGSEVYRRRQRPLVLEGFQSWLVDNGYIGFPDIDPYLDGTYPEFSAISRAIKGKIRQEQITGGMAGIYNPSITARLNGLTEKQELKFVEQPLFGNDE